MRAFGRSIAPPWSAAAAAGLLLLALPGHDETRAQWPTWLNKSSSPVIYPEILVTPRWLNERLGRKGLVVVDARGWDTPHHGGFNEGHIAGAWPTGFDDVHAFSSIPEGILESAAEIVLYDSRDHPLSAGEAFHVFCGRSGWRPRLRVLNGGLEGWRRAGLPITSESSGTLGKLRVMPGTSAEDPTIATADWIAAHLGAPGVTIIDVRPIPEWEAGHVPHSLPFDFNDCLNGDGTLMDGPAMRPILASIGPRARDYINLEDTIVVIGHPAPGARAHPFLALTVAGIDRVRMAEVSFADWRASHRPVTRIVHAAEAVRMIADAHRGRFRDEPAPGLILLDLRHEPDFDSGHLPGAILLPPHRFDAQLDSIVAANWPGVDRATVPFAVYCYGPDCVRSRNMTTKAAQRGFRNLLWLRDGPGAFEAAGGTLSRN